MCCSAGSRCSCLTLDEPLEELRVCLPSCVWQAGHSLRAPTSLHALADILQPFAVKDALLGRSGNAQESAGVSLPTAQRRRPQGLRRRFASQEIVRQSCYLCRAVHRHSRCVHIECLFMRICHPRLYRTGRVAASGQLHAMHLHLPCLPLQSR